MYVASRAVVAFIERLVRDREFREWYFLEPEAALVSHNLDANELRDAARLVGDARWGGAQPVVRAAVRPLFEMLLEAINEPQARHLLLARCDDLIATARERALAAQQRRKRPWWRFWRV